MRIEFGERFVEELVDFGQLRMPVPVHPVDLLHEGFTGLGISSHVRVVGVDDVVGEVGLLRGLSRLVRADGWRSSALLTSSRSRSASAVASDRGERWPLQQ